MFSVSRILLARTYRLAIIIRLQQQQLVSQGSNFFDRSDRVDSASERPGPLLGNMVPWMQILQEDTRASAYLISARARGPAAALELMLPRLNLNPGIVFSGLLVIEKFIASLPTTLLLECARLARSPGASLRLAYSLFFSLSSAP